MKKGSQTKRTDPSSREPVAKGETYEGVAASKRETWTKGGGKNTFLTNWVNASTRKKKTKKTRAPPDSARRIAYFRLWTTSRRRSLRLKKKNRKKNAKKKTLILESRRQEKKAEPVPGGRESDGSENPLIKDGHPKFAV